MFQARPVSNGGNCHWIVCLGEIFTGKDLIGGLEHDLVEFPFSWEWKIIPTDALIFFRGVGINHRFYMFFLTIKSMSGVGNCPILGILDITL